MATILVADDNRANRLALVAWLEHAGHRVLTASDGAKALETARTEHPQLVISDVLMPEMDGYELARRLRADPGTASTGIIFYTAYFGRQEAQQLAQSLGVQKVLVKPSDPDLILTSIDEALASRPCRPSADAAAVSREHLRVMVDQLLEKTSALEAQQQRIERMNRTLSVLSAVNALIVRADDRQALLDEACRIAVERGGFGFAAIGLLEGSARGLRAVAAAGEGSGDPRIEAFPPQPRQALCNDLEIGYDIPGRDAALRRGFRSYVVLPLEFGGSAAGALLLYARAPGVFDEEEMKLLQELAGDIAFALHHIEQKARMDYLAYHDSLTDLPNRSLFIDRLVQALSGARRERRVAAAVMVDVERFRMMNETFGRKAGDELLRQVGVRLAREARDQDTVARIGADHFAIVVAGYHRTDDASQQLLERLERAFAVPVSIDSAELRVSLKAGVAVFPDDGDAAETLIANAETALKKAKEGGQRHLYYAPYMNASVAESVALENRLRRALDMGYLALHYQPKVDMRTSALAGLEALIRWNDPELGIVPPSKFVALLEETGMILPAGRWALRRAVEDVRRWQELGLKVPRTSVNVSAIELRQKDFVDSVLEAILPFGAEPLLDLEITESVLLDDIDDSTRKLQALRQAGVEVSVDDFGTGYSSLSYLAKLPVDTLKIDRSFVIRLREAGYPRNIVAMMVTLAHTLGLKVVAEGVEEDEQRQLLSELGCDQIQGFLISKPLPYELVVPMLQAANDGVLRKAG